MTRAADTLVNILVKHGIDRIFCVPGESYLAVIDAMYDTPQIDVVTTRHEGGASFMAVADAKMTNIPGIVMVSRGPGATNASIGIHVAQQDAVPLIMFVGQVSRTDIGRGAFQEINYSKMFGGIAKWVVEITDPQTLEQNVLHAFEIAQSGVPGPVIVSLPEDILHEEIEVLDLKPSRISQPTCKKTDINKVVEILSVAQRPLIIAGGQIGAQKGRQALQITSEKWNIPVATSWRHQDLFNVSHPNFACHLAFNMPPNFKNTLNESDLIIAIGTRLGDVVTQGYQLPSASKPNQKLVHIYNDPQPIGKVFKADLAIISDATEFLLNLNMVKPPKPSPAQLSWIEKVHSLSADKMKWKIQTADDGVPFGNIIFHLREMMAEDAITAIDAGNFATFVHRLFDYKITQTQLAAVAGAMGMGVPAAIAGALRYPDRQVVCFVGDGGFQMTGNEISVAVERKLPVRFIISKNGSLGTIRLYQEKSYPDRTLATDIINPDFAKIAESYGANGFKITTNADIPKVMKEAFSINGPCLIEVTTSLEYLAAYTNISDIRNTLTSTKK
ncbi:MAG: thiamine pyrophosphate-dependent enzyme [Pseudomonadota bacterium]|nr:thiamine pyrophosphate-dependent enzyme [Pseudomonadota bacterium]